MEMPRPRLNRIVWLQPNFTYFKPAGIRIRDLDEVVLAVDEFEAIRLADFEEMDQEVAAKKMSISQPTFNRVLRCARKKLSEAIVKGKAIRIEGGDYQIAKGRRRFGRSF